MRKRRACGFGTWVLAADEWAEVALADLSRAHPDLRALATRIDIMRWGHAMIRPTHASSGATPAATPHPHGAIHFPNTNFSAVALCEQALHHGVRAAEDVIAALEIDSAKWR